MRGGTIPDACASIALLNRNFLRSTKGERPQGTVENSRLVRKPRAHGRLKTLCPLSLSQAGFACFKVSQRLLQNGQRIFGISHVRAAGQ